MELRQLRYFVAVAEYGGFTRAAEHLRVAQPPVSRQVAQLEAELGAKLFDRSGRNTTLTNVGERFLVDVRRIIHDLEISTHRARSLSAASGTVRVSFGPSSFALVVPEVLRRYADLDPDTEVRLSERRPSEIIAELQDFGSDVGFIHQARPPNDGIIEVETILREPLIVAVPATHRLAQQTSVSITHLADEDFVLNQSDPCGGTLGIVLDVCRTAGFTPRARQTVWLQHTVLGLVGAGVGITLVPRSATLFARPDVRYLELTDCSSSVTVDVLWRRDNTDPRASKLVQAARDWGKETHYRLAD